MKVLCITMFSPDYEPIADITIPVLKKYCEQHGYEFEIIPCSDGQYSYVKHEYIQEQLKRTDIDAIFYLDCDAVITNPEIKIESLIDEQHDLFISEDVTEINGGVFILKNDEWGHFFNNTVLEERDTFANEQNCYNHYKDHPNFKPHIKILPQSQLNSYDYSLYPECKDRVGREDLGDWKPNHFVFHVPALTIPQRVEALKKHIIYD